MVTYSFGDKCFNRCYVPCWLKCILICWVIYLWYKTLICFERKKKKVWNPSIFGSCDHSLLHVIIRNIFLYVFWTILHVNEYFKNVYIELGLSSTQLIYNFNFSFIQIKTDFINNLKETRSGQTPNWPCNQVKK